MYPYGWKTNLYQKDSRFCPISAHCLPSARLFSPQKSISFILLFYLLSFFIIIFYVPNTLLFFLLCSKGTQSHIRVHMLFSPFILLLHKWPDRVPSTPQQDVYFLDVSINKNEGRFLFLTPPLLTRKAYRLVDWPARGFSSDNIPPCTSHRIPLWV